MCYIFFHDNYSLFFCRENAQSTILLTQFIIPYHPQCAMCNAHIHKNHIFRYIPTLKWEITSLFFASHADDLYSSTQMQTHECKSAVCFFLFIFFFLSLSLTHSICQSHSNGSFLQRHIIGWLFHIIRN